MIYIILILMAVALVAVERYLNLRKKLKSQDALIDKLKSNLVNISTTCNLVEVQLKKAAQKQKITDISKTEPDKSVPAPRFLRAKP
jgi:hypothetical protein